MALPTGMPSADAGAASALGETRQLFACLGNVQRLVREADARRDAAPLARALALLDEHTYDARWRADVAARYEAFAQEPRGAAPPPQHDAVPHLRIERAREGGDALRLANMLVRHGLYRDALMAYSAGEHRDECVSNLNVLQGNWALVQATLGKPAALDALPNALLLNLALAHWSVGQYGDALAVLLRLAPDAELVSAWLAPADVLGMLVASALVTLDRDALKYFARADPVFLALSAQSAAPLVAAALRADAAACWPELAALPLPPVGADVPAPEQPRALLRDRILKDWLFVHDKLGLACVLDTFAAGRGAAEGRDAAAYTVVDLVEDLRRWDAPYRVSTGACAGAAGEAGGVVEAYEPAVDNAAAAQELARWFKRDALVRRLASGAAPA